MEIIELRFEPRPECLDSRPVYLVSARDWPWERCLELSRRGVGVPVELLPGERTAPEVIGMLYLLAAARSDGTAAECVVRADSRAVWRGVAYVKDVVEHHYDLAFQEAE